MRNVKQQDLFMQWYPVASALDGTDSSDLVEAEFTTGLSIRGDYAWLIHTVELYMPTVDDLAADNMVHLVLSTNQGEAAIPTIDERGVICALGWSHLIATSGRVILGQPLVWKSLPPTVIATPKLSFYCSSRVDAANLRGDAVYGRIGFTTVPIDQKLYLEIAETFERL